MDAKRRIQRCSSEPRRIHAERSHRHLVARDVEPGADRISNRSGRRAHHPRPLHRTPHQRRKISLRQRRIIQKSQIMHGHHPCGPDGRRQHEVRPVHHVRPPREQLDRRKSTALPKHPQHPSRNRRPNSPRPRRRHFTELPPASSREPDQPNVHKRRQFRDQQRRVPTDPGAVAQQRRSVEQNTQVSAHGTAHRRVAAVARRLASRPPAAHPRPGTPAAARGPGAPPPCR